MAQLLGLEWDSREIRVAVACGRGSRVVVERAFAIPLTERELEGDALAEHIGQRVAAELDLRRIGRGEALVGIGRGSIELRQLQLPPAPDDELPEMVRFQAMREFNEFDDRWLLDFSPIDDARDAPRAVLATAIAPSVFQQVDKVCQRAGLKMRRLVLRPCEAASLLGGDRAAPSDQLRLLVVFFGDEADLTVTIGGRAVFLRTMRSAGDSPSLQALTSEIRLTMAAVQNQLGGRAVQSIVLCGQGSASAELARGLETALGIRVEVFDPFSAVELGAAMRGSLPADPGRFASLLGMLRAEFSQTAHAIDFLHPRHRPEPPSRRRTWILAGVAAVVLLFAYLAYEKNEHAKLVEKVEGLKTESASLDAVATRGQKLQADVAEIAKVADVDVVWLDQLHRLVQEFPTSEEAIINELTCSVQAGKRQIDVKGRARDEKVMEKINEKVGAGIGQVKITSSKLEESVKPYAWSFEAQVTVSEGAKP